MNKDVNRENTKGQFLFSNRDLLLLFIPIFVELFLQYLVGLADSIMVSHVGEAAVSGVSLVNFIMQLIVSLFAALCTGGAVLAGQYLGKKETDRAIEAADQLVWFVGMSSFLLMAAVLIMRNAIIGSLFGQISADVRRNAEIYFSFVVPSIPFLALTNAGAAVFRTSGNSSLPMRIMMAVNCVNVIGNAVLIYVCHMGTAGIAIPTLLSRVLGAVIMITLVLNSRYPLHIKRRLTHHFNWTIIKKILTVGVPFALENSLFFLGRLLVLSLISTLGTPSIAANSIALTLALFSVLPAQAINLGMTTVISRCVGAGDFSQARYYHRKILLIIYAALWTVNIVIISFLPRILAIYNLSAVTYQLTYRMVFWHASITVLIWPIAYSFPVTFRSAGDARFPMIAAVGCMLGRIVLSYVFIQVFSMGVFSTYIAMFADWIVKTVLFLFRYKSRKWMRFHLT